MPQRDLSYTIIELMQDTARNMKAQPVNLGGIAGTGGGEGGPPGGFIGWLPQTRVAYDTDEAATLDTVGSGTLLDNLNHIRYRLQTLEAGSGVLIVDEWDGSPEVNLVERLTFSGAIVTEVAPGHALVQITGSGGGASDFLDLTDTPSSYTGHAGKAVAVKDTEDGLEFVVMEGGDLSGYVPYVGATQNVNLGNRNITVSGESRLGLTQIREGNYLQIGANGLVFGPSDPDIQETSSFIAFGEGFGGGNTRLQEYGNQGMFGVTVDADTGPVLLAGYTDGFEDIEAKLGDIDGEFYHGYHLKIYSGGAEFNSNLNLVGDFTYNINGVPHTHSGGGGTPLSVQDTTSLTPVENVDLITFNGATVADMGGGEALVLLPTLTVEEYGGTPEVDDVIKIIFSGADVTDLGGGDVLVTISGGGGSDSFPNPFALTEEITPPAITADVTDLDPTGGETADVWRLEASGGAWKIRGIAGGVDGRILILYNIAGSSANTLTLQSGFGASGNQVDNDYVIGFRSAVALQYDGTAGKWRVLGGDSTSLRGFRIDENIATTLENLQVLRYFSSSNSFTGSHLFLDSEGDPAPVGTTAADGTSGFGARRDHVHAGAKVLLHDQTLGGTAGSINIYPTGDIPAGAYLHIRVKLRTNKAGAASEGVKIEINDDTGNNYSRYLMFHFFDSQWNDEETDGGAPATNFYVNAATAPSNEFAVYDIWVYDYAATSSNKNIQIRGQQRSSTSAIFFYDSAMTWHPATPVAITKIELIPADGNSFIAGCRVTAWREQ